jgi:L-amino acid N-acyltransferase YncA
MTCRRCEPGDREALRGLLAESSPYITVQSGYVYWMLERYLHPFFYVAEENGQLAGFACGLPSRTRGCLFIWQIQIAEAWQRRGVGLDLAMELARAARSEGLRALELSVNRKNRPSLGLAEALARRQGSVPIALEDKEMDQFGDVLFRIEL